MTCTDDDDGAEFSQQVCSRRGRAALCSSLEIQHAPCDPN